MEKKEKYTNVLILADVNVLFPTSSMCAVKAERGYQRVRVFLPQAAGGVAQQHGGLEPDPVVVPL